MRFNESGDTMNSEDICSKYGLNGSVRSQLERLERKLGRMGLTSDHIDAAIREASEMPAFKKYGGTQAIKKIYLVHSDIFIEGAPENYLISVHECGSVPNNPGRNSSG